MKERKTLATTRMTVFAKWLFLCRENKTRFSRCTGYNMISWCKKKKKKKEKNRHRRKKKNSHKNNSLYSHGSAKVLKWKTRKKERIARGWFRSIDQNCENVIVSLVHAARAENRNRTEAVFQVEATLIFFKAWPKRIHLQKTVRLGETRWGHAQTMSVSTPGTSKKARSRVQPDSQGQGQGLRVSSDLHLVFKPWLVRLVCSSVYKIIGRYRGMLSWSSGSVYARTNWLDFEK